MKNNTTICLVLSSCFILCLLSSEINAQVSYYKRASGSIIQSPEPGNFSSNAGVDDVDYNSGTLNINIPLYEIVSNDITVPITLNYSALGLKVGQRAGPVGMGWELRAGGTIKTIVNGLPDDGTGGLSTGYNPMLSLPVNSLGLDIENNTTHRNHAIDVMEGKADGAWDAYVYSLPTKSGKFMRPRGQLITFPFDPTIAQTSGGYVFGDGLKYEFEAGDSRRMKSRTFYTEVYPPQTPQFTTGWRANFYDYYDQNLKWITSSKYKDTVSFHYEAITTSTRLAAKEIITTMVSMPVSTNVIKNSSNQWVLATPRSYMIKEPSVSQSKIETIRHTRIKYIYFNHGRISFNYGNDYNGNDVLNNIRVEKKVGNAYILNKEFEFIYQFSYAHYLQGIRVKDSQSNIIYGWEFAYFDVMPVNPSGETLAQDRWGFYNGQTTNLTLIENPNENISFTNKSRYPVYNEEGSINGNWLYLPRNSEEARFVQSGYNNPALPNKINFANREFVFSEAIKGTLKSVVTPTGTLVEYEYESHRFPHFYKTSSGTTSTQTKHGGGIRIKRITHKSKTHGNLLGEREFKYGTGNYWSPNSSYVEDGLGYVSYPGTVITNKAVYGGTGGSSQTFQNLVFLSHPVNEMAYSGGSYAAYPSVSEYIVKDINASGTQRYSGRTTYFYPVPSLDSWQSSGGPDNFNYGGIHVKPGVQEDMLHNKLSCIIKWRDLSIKAEETIYSYKRFAAPALTEPRNAHSFFTGITGSLLSPYMSSSMSISVSVYEQGQGFITTTMEIESAPITIDPLYVSNIYRENSYTYFPGKYFNAIHDMNALSNTYKMESARVVTYSDQSSQIIQDVTTQYRYNNIAHLLPSYVGTVNSVGDSIIQRTKFAKDYSTSSPSFIQTMKANNMVTIPIEETTTVKRNEQELLTFATSTWYSTIPGPYFSVSKITKLNTNGRLVPFSNYNGLTDARHETTVSFDKFDDRNNLLQYGNYLDSKTSQIWGYGKSKLIAQVEGAATEDVAYTGFESSDKGNWTYSGTSVTTAGTATGNAAYTLSTGTISKSQLTANTTYIVSYWYKEGGAVSVSGGTVSQESILKTHGGWKLAERQITGATTVSISGNATVDDVRLHPFNAQMTTYTHEPLVGITSVTDAKGRREYYFYDEANRLKQIRDQDNNIVKHISYNIYNGQPYSTDY